MARVAINNQLDSNLKTRFIRLKEVKDLTTLSTSEIYRQITKGSFPRQIHLGPKMVVWLESDIQEWMSMLVQQAENGRSR